MCIGIGFGTNHSERKVQSASDTAYPIPPPLGVVFLPHVTCEGRGILSVSSGIVGSDY